MGLDVSILSTGGGGVQQSAVDSAIAAHEAAATAHAAATNLLHKGAGEVEAADINANLKPSGSASASTESLRRLGTSSSHAAAGNDSRFPTSGEKSALAGTNGTPGSGNRYVTASGLSATLADYLVIADITAYLPTQKIYQTAVNGSHSVNTTYGKLDPNGNLDVSADFYPVADIFIVEVCAYIEMSSSVTYDWKLECSGDVSGTLDQERRIIDGQYNGLVRRTFFFTGVTPGETITMTVKHKASTGSVVNHVVSDTAPEKQGYLLVTNVLTPI